MTRLRKISIAVALPAAIGLVVAGVKRPSFDPAPFLADLQALEDSTAAGYANLEWQVQQGVVDPVALHRRTDSLIRVASSASQATAALVAFGAAMHDGHYRVRRPTNSVVRWFTELGAGSEDGPPNIAKGASNGCRSLGYKHSSSSSPLASHENYHALGRAKALFPVGIVSHNDHRIGVLRIGSFGVDQFLSACEQAWPTAARFDSSGVCASKCRRQLRLSTSDSLLSSLRQSIRLLVQEGATTLVVDLTGNGGGTEWVTPAARQFTSIPLQGHIAAAIRHPHYEPRLVDAVAELRAAVVAATDSGWRAQLTTALTRAQSQLDDVRSPCDRRAIWRQGASAIQCTQLATRMFTTGFLDYLPVAMRGMSGAGVAFTPATFAYEEGIWSGPLVLLVDRNTASASEDFVVALKDHGAARVIGQRTYGAGCGYTNGGIGFALPHSKLRVAMPDCARIRGNGRNEVSGIEVDQEVKLDADAVIEAIRQP